MGLPNVTNTLITDFANNICRCVVGAIIRGSLLWGLVWLVLSLAGIIVQVSNTQHYEKGYAQSQF